MIYRPLSVEFQKVPEPDVEEAKPIYGEKGSVHSAETDINNSLLETGKDDIAEYYRKNIGSLISFHGDKEIVVKPDGTIIHTDYKECIPVGDKVLPWKLF